MTGLRWILDMDEILSEVGSSEGLSQIEDVLTAQYERLAQHLRHQALEAERLSDNLTGEQCENNVRSIKHFRDKIKTAKELTELFDHVIALLTKQQPENGHKKTKNNLQRPVSNSRLWVRHLRTFRCI